MSLFGNWASANNNQQQQQQPNAFSQPSGFGQQTQPAPGMFKSILPAKTTLTPIIQSHFTALLFVGFSGFSTQGQQPQQSGFGTSQPQNTFGGEARTLRVIYYNNTSDYQDLVELAHLQNPQVPSGGLVRRQIRLVQQQASELLVLLPNLLGLQPGLQGLVKLPWLDPPALGLGVSVGQPPVAGAMRVLPKHLDLEVWNLSTRFLGKF